MCYCLNHCVWPHGCAESPLNKPHERSAANAMIVDSFEIVQEKKPHVCPVCNGNGQKEISYGFFEDCKACEGACVLWG